MVNGVTVPHDFLLTPIVNGTIDGMVTNVLQAPLADVNITVGNATNPSITQQVPGEAALPKSTPGFAASIAIAAIGALYMLWRKRR